MKEDFDINKKVEEIPVEEIEGFFHEMDLTEGEEKPTSEEKKENSDTEEVEGLEKSNLNNFL